jgi:acyl-CoA reductase-like NAD-dependent aldehyde dehydrogenase
VTAASMTIDGSPAPAEQTFGVINPATGRVYEQAPDCLPEQLDAAFAAAARAYRNWKADESMRREVMLAGAAAMFTAADEIGAIFVAEQGKPLADAKGEAIGAGAWLKYFARLEMPREEIQDDDRAFTEVVRRPLGVVAAITPWNYPVMLAAWKIAPALLAGNTMVLKPSPFTPLATLRMGEILAGVLPPGVLNVVSGGDHLGRRMTAHPVPRKISFTGSVAAGRHVAAAAAADLKRITLELGGNDPAILLDDMDPAAIAGRLFWGAFQNNGQVCSAIKRVYAPRRLYAEVVEVLAAQARAAKVGDGSRDGVQLGPVNNKPQFDRVSQLVANALASGGTAVSGGAPADGDGYFYTPTIVAGLTDGSRLVDEEQFGPALPVVAYDDLDDAVERANATHFGLSGSVWASDPERAATVAARLECGTAWVNTHLALAPYQPFGGAKWSGIGVENGPWGLHAFTELQVLHQARK